MGYTLAIDQGTHSSRAYLFDENGKCVHSVTQKITLIRQKNGFIEHDIHEICESVKNVIHQVVNSISESQKNKISSCGIATQRSSVIAWNKNGEALSPVLSWQDVRGREFLKSIQDREEGIQQKTGLPLSAHYGASKLNWLLKHNSKVQACDPEQLNLSPLVSYLLFHLVQNKKYVVDHSNAQRTQLMDIKKLEWSEELTEIFAVPEKYLPRCKPMCTEYGLLEEVSVPVTAVCGDQNAALFGIGDIDEQDILINIGSGAFILRKQSTFNQNKCFLNGISYSDNSTVLYLLEATINGAGNALRWIEDELHTEGIMELLPTWLNEVKEPPVFLNTIGSLGSPWWREGIAPQFVSDNNSDDDSVKIVAVLESIIFLIQVNLEIMNQSKPVKQIIVSGGLSNLDGLCQKLASLSGLKTKRVLEKEATARGVAYLAAGKPTIWNTEVDYDVFEPETNEALKIRYEKFKGAMNNLLDNSL